MAFFNTLKFSRRSVYLSLQGKATLSPKMKQNVLKCKK